MIFKCLCVVIHDFFSKIRTAAPSDMDQWAVRSVASLGSFPSASVVMDTPRMHGSGKVKAGTKCFFGNNYYCRQ